MADERDLELLDDYLSNRMGGAERSDFEGRLQADPDLQNEYTLQKNLVQGIREARVSELKSMLNKVPVPSGGHGGALTSKAVLGAVTIIIAAATYWYLTRSEKPAPGPDAVVEQEIPGQQPVEPSNVPEEKILADEKKPAPPESVDPDRNQTSAGTEHSKPSLSKKPDPVKEPAKKDEADKSNQQPVLDVFVPGAEEESAGDNRNVADPGSLRPTGSSLAVETDTKNSRYSFHYQFRDGKLFLYGPFEKNLYEIMEFFSDRKRTVFLYYNNHYYLLSESDSQVRPLTAIKDPALLKKLDESRSSQ